MARAIRIGSEPVRVAIADDSGLLFSDDYRAGWVKGFRTIGCEVKVFDIRAMRGATGVMSPYATRHRSMPKMIGKEIARWRPDLLWCHHGRTAAHEFFLQEIRKHGCKTAVYLCDEPYEVGETARYSPKYTHVFTMDPCTMRAHKLSRKGRENVFYLPPAVDPDLFPYADYKNRSVNAFFLGNAGLTPRKSWLGPVERTVDGADIRFFPDKRGRGVGKGHAKWIPLSEHAKHYSGCIIGLNVHRDPRITKECHVNRVIRRPQNLGIPEGIKLAEKPDGYGTGFWNDANLPAAHVNPRFFEFASCGTCVISDAHRLELTRMFPMAPRAQDAEHFLELVHYYINNPEEAEAIGKACNSLILNRHTYRHRAAEVLIRVGLKDKGEENLRTYLGEPEGYLSPQGFNEHGAELFWGATGHSERWSPAYGKSLIEGCGSLKESGSLDATNEWLS